MTVRLMTSRRAPRVVVLSAARAAEYEPQDAAVCVSVGDPDQPDVPLSPRFASVLRLKFSDIVEDSGLPSDVLFDRSHARTLLEFLDHWSRVDTVVVHCRAGLSRSPAIAIAIAELNGDRVADLEREHPLWNKHVRATIVGTALEHRDAEPTVEPRHRMPTKPATRERARRTHKS
jgi:predicted protein tyrosine phosphatase